MGFLAITRFQNHLPSKNNVYAAVYRLTNTKAYADRLVHKINIFKEETPTNKTLHLTMITTRGLARNNGSDTLVRHDLKMELLFDE